MKAIVGAKSDVGRVRDGNEDSYLVNDPMFGVADGMGGHLAGDVASRTAVETITDRAGESMPRGGDELAELLSEANAVIWEKATGDSSLRGMGTTCTLIKLDGAHIDIAHVGDSRAYLFRDGEITQLTEDHTLVGKMVREGRLKPEEAERHPQRSIITRALGVDSEVDVDVLSIELLGDDRVLICSDGLTSMLDQETLREVLEAEGDPQAAVERLVDLANEAGGEDNITVVVIWFRNDEDTGPRSTMERRTVAPEVERAPTRTETGTKPEPARSSRFARRLFASVLVLAVLFAGAFFLIRYSLSNSWYVGANDEGIVTIFSGIPESIAGLDLSSEEETSDLALTDLPEFLRDDVEIGIKVESRDEAESKIRDLEERAEDEEFQKDQNAGDGGDKNRSGSN